MSNRSNKESKRSRSRSPTKSKVKSKRLLVSNIPFNVTLKELKDIFKEKIGICGKLDYIDKNGKFTGNAVMEFKTLDGAQKAVSEMHKYSLNGREIIVREETNKDRDRLNIGPAHSNQMTMGPAPDSIYQLINDLERDGPITNSLFIANLDYSLTWQKLKDMFKNAGRVKHVDLKTDADGKSRGFGTVEFESPEEAVMAIYLFHDKKVSGREIKLRMDKSGKSAVGGIDMSMFADLDSGSSSNLSPHIRRVLEEILSSITNPNRSNPQAMKALQELLSLAQLMDKNQTSNFPASDNFSVKSNFDRNSGFGYNTPRSWNDIVQSSVGSEMLFNQSFDSPYYRDRGLSDSRPPGSFHDYPPSRMGREYPDSPRDVRFNIGNSQNSSMTGSRDLLLLEDILHKLKTSNNVDQLGVLNVLSSVFNKRGDDSFSGINSRLSGNDFMNDSASSNTLLIKNIPFSYTWKDLKHSFSQAPGIVHTEIMRDDFNRSKGIGLVRFETHADAVRCKNMMDGTLFDGRPIHIDFSNMLK